MRHMGRVARVLAPVMLAVLPLAACGGGGGGSVNPMPAPPPPAPPPPPPPPPPPSDFRTQEFRSNYGLGQIGAEYAYIEGATGQGVTVAVIDSGIDIDNPEFTGRIDPASKDILTSRGSLNDVDGHGTLVSGIIAANRDAAGMHGVAFDSKILAVRSEERAPCSGTDDDPDECVYNNEDLANAVDYAVANGAEIINLSLGGDPQLAGVLRQALIRAVNAGVLVVGSSGNDGNAEPDAPGNFASDSAARGRAVVVGAVNRNSVIAGFSNKAGATAAQQNVFLVAPGERVVTTGNDGGYYYVSGTSFAAPHVSGALALLLDAFPNIAAADALDILFETAEDLGAAGPDPVYGMGQVDLQAAFQPVGATSAHFGGAETVPTGMIAAPPSGAMGDWAQASGAFEDVMIRDTYRRGFRVDFAAPAPYSGTLDRFEALGAARATRGSSMRTRFGGGYLRWNDEPDIHPNLGRDELQDLEYGMELEVANVSFGYARGAAAPGPVAQEAMSLLTPQDQNGALAAYTSGRDWVYGGVALGGWRLAARSSSGDDSRQFSAVSLERSLPGANVIGFETGVAQERGSALGSLIAFRTGGEDSAESSFYALEWSGPLWVGWRARARGEIAFAELGRAAGMTVEDDPWASAWSVGAERAYDWGALSFLAAQSLRAEGGAVSFTAPVQSRADGSTIYERRVAGLTPSGREIGLETMARFDLGEGAQLRTALRYAADPGHVSTAEDEVALWADFTIRR